MTIKYKSEQNGMRPQTCAAALIIKFIASKNMQMCCPTQFTEQSPCSTSAKVDSQSWSRQCDKKVNLHTYVGKIMKISEHQLKYVFQILAFLQNSF